MSKLTANTNYNTWNTASSVNTNVERLMDDATYSSAHPDDTLVIAGPPRVPENGGGSDGGYGAFSAVGMVQNISMSQQKPFQPMMAIGSSRSFYAGGKSQGSAQVQRLFMNTNNLMRQLYDNSIGPGANQMDPKTLSSLTSKNAPSSTNNTNYFINLDSEFFLVPFGLGVIFKNKARGSIGGFYMELCVIPSFSVAVQAGQSMIMEAVTLFFDRVVPLDVTGTSTLAAAFDKITKPA